MKRGHTLLSVRVVVGLFCSLIVIPSALLAAQPDSRAMSEVVATAQSQPQSWHYTLAKPGGEWTSAGFDDSSWQAAPAPFGTPNTPGIRPATPWSSPDIWLRRAVQMPQRRLDVSALQLIAFHDEDVEIYFDGVLAARAGGFVRDYESLDISPDARKLLKPGAAITLAVHCHQTSGGQGIDVGVAELSTEMLAQRRRDRYRGFAMSNPGNVDAGQKVFNNSQRLACAKCHTTDGSAALAGPDLSTIGDKYPRAELINQILQPSASIAIGYETTIVTAKSGETVVGVVKEATDDSLGLMGGDGKLVRVKLADIRSRRTQNTSLMPSDLESGLSREEFADVIEYLVSLHLPAHGVANRQGMPAQIPALDPPIKLTPIHRAENHFEAPCWMGQMPAQPGTFLVCEHQTGRVWKLTTGDGESKSLWGDFRREIRPGGATGLLGLAFHPKFRENHKYYIQHQVLVDNGIVARVSEKTASEDFTRDSSQPSRTIIEFPCSTDVHSGGGICFGPDGYLYIGMGDTGPQGDPQGHGQDVRTPLGKMLRIDVDRADANAPYSAPADNPFRSRSGARDEIWACGFREPWRFSFDKLTNDLWVGDVGQDRIEEVDLVRKGENYGWNVYEGFDLFSTRYRSDGANYVPPVFAYNRKLGNSVTGGYVYRGDAKSPFYGVYVCGDFTSKRVWGLKQTDRKLTAAWQLCNSPEEIASFGQDDAGALYLVGYKGTIYRLDFGAAAPGPM